MIMVASEQSLKPSGGVLRGISLLPRGLAIIARRPKLFLLGAIPPLITSILLVMIIVGLAAGLPAITAALTPFADAWQAAELVRALLGVLIMAGTLLLAVVSFTTLTTALGSPLYDKISQAVDAEFGELPPEREEKLAVGVGRAIRQSLALIMISAGVAIAMLPVGLIPVVGQIVAPVISALAGGWLLSTELIGSTFERRGLLTLAERRAAMRRARALVWGFGVPTFLLLAIPFVAIVVFPIATAGGTILGRLLLGLPTTPVTRRAAH